MEGVHRRHELLAKPLCQPMRFNQVREIIRVVCELRLRLRLVTLREEASGRREVVTSYARYLVKRDDLANIHEGLLGIEHVTA